MNFVYEHLRARLNLIKITNRSRENIRRFVSSPAASKMIFFHRIGKPLSYTNDITDYVIPIGVGHPNDWASGEFSNTNMNSCLSNLPSNYLNDIQTGKALLLIDQTLEGYQTKWLWEYFHKDCKDHRINPCSIVFFTGNLLAKDQYAQWADQHNIVDRINIFPYPLFESDIFEIHTREKPIRNSVCEFDEYFNYKKEHQTEIKTFDCLQKRLRNHRLWLYQYLFDADLVSQGLISMNPFADDKRYQYSSGWMEGRRLDPERVRLSNEILPLTINGKNNNEHDDGYYRNRICKDVYKNTWVSVVSEASFSDEEDTLFLSEKTFKPITCMQPFIIFGNKGSLKKMRERGYKTFDGFIDESYDELSTFDRLEAIIQAIKKISEIKDKLEWYMSMKDILIHNYNMLEHNSINCDPSLVAFNNYYNQFFKK
jgi:hypothetical protein